MGWLYERAHIIRRFLARLPQQAAVVLEVEAALREVRAHPGQRRRLAAAAGESVITC